MKPGHSKFDQGILFAVSRILETHGDTVIASDVLRCSDLRIVDVSKMDVYDQQYLVKLTDEKNLSMTGFDQYVLDEHQKFLEDMLLC